MTQQLVSRASFEEVARTAVAQAERLLQRLEALASTTERLRADAKTALGPQVHWLNDVDDTPVSGLKGCLALLLPPPPHRTTIWTMALARWAEWESRSVEVRRHESVLRDELTGALAACRAVPRRGFFGTRKPALAPPAAVDRLLELCHWAEVTGFAADLDRLLDHDVPVSREPSESEIVRGVAVVLGLTCPPDADPVLQLSDVQMLRAVLEGGSHLQRNHERLVDTITATYEKVRDRMVDRRLRELSVTVIADASAGHLRVSALEESGLTTVHDVLEHASRLQSLPGVGHQTATDALATARSLRRTVREDLRLRIDLDEEDALLTSLVSSLHVLLVFEAGLAEHRGDIATLMSLLGPWGEMPSTDGPVALLHRHSPRRGGDVVRHLLERLDWVEQSGLGALLVDTTLSALDGATAWDDFRRRSFEYQGLLAELLGVTVDVEAAQGHLPSDVVEAVQQQNLDTSALRVSLRGYQAFGARFCLVQRRVLVGDEMGLGKTVQALAVMAHLSANGADHFLVVCPSAVLVNWMKEVRRHSLLEPMRVHGPDRDRNWRHWRSRGGVAITSYDTLRRLDPTEIDVDLLVADEAHYIKNPDALRSRAVVDLVGRSDRTMFLTGTPLENRVLEFQNLVGYLQPEVAAGLDGASMVLGARAFREAVAPVYLRRNSEDVLTELPDLVQTEEWVEFTDRERTCYLEALHGNNFQQMRRVGFTGDPEGSHKLKRLEAIVEESLANGRNVVVFSTFLDVLDAVRQRLGDRVLGLITGSVSPDRRQGLVDLLTESSKPSVLLSQIVAGGVGLNLQAASVVILCEPQVKPSLEDQAVKRAHRMGQLRTVQVHRLLTEDSVDERMLEILGQKSKVFEEYVGHSDVAAASPEATDKTDTAVAKQVLAHEQERYAKELRERFAGQTTDAGARHDSDVPATQGPPPAEVPAPIIPPPKPFVTSPEFERRLVRTVCGSCGRPIDPTLMLCGCS